MRILPSLSLALLLGLPLLQGCERDATFGERPDIPEAAESGADPADTVLEAENRLNEGADQAD